MLVMALAMMVAAVTGCAPESTTSEPANNTQPVKAASQDQAAMPKMTCPMCNEGPPAVETGTATQEDGVQVVRITQKDGYYSPNEIALKAGMPAKLIFTGDSKDCSGKPMIEALNMKADFTQAGEATMDLATVSAGTYKLTCGMGSAGGSVIVE